MSVIDAIRTNLKPSTLAVIRKLEVLKSGQAKVSKNCQIPKLKDKYRELGLKDNNGTFVEVGGFDGESWSNTSFLADQGWRGLYIEPIPKYARRIRYRHLLNKVSIEVAAVSDRAGRSEIDMMGPLTTLRSEQTGIYETLDWAKEFAAGRVRTEIRTDTLAGILSRHGFVNSCDLMIVDVEGAEEPIIDQVLASDFKPKVLIVELEDRHPDFKDNSAHIAPHVRARSKLIEAGYDEFYSDHINTIFRRPG